MTGAEKQRLPALPVVVVVVIVVVVVVVCISFVVLTENGPSAVFSVMLASYLPSLQMLKPSANQVAQDCRGLSKGAWGFEGGGDSPPLTLTNHGPCFFCLLSLFFPLPPFFPVLSVCAVQDSLSSAARGGPSLSRALCASSRAHLSFQVGAASCMPFVCAYMCARACLCVCMWVVVAAAAVVQAVQAWNATTFLCDQCFCT